MDNNGNDSGIILENIMPNIGYRSTIHELSDFPLNVKHIRIHSENHEQILQTILIKYHRCNGQMFTEPIITKEYYDEYQVNENIIDIDRSFRIDGRLEMSCAILPKTSVDFTFFEEGIGRVGTDWR